MHLYNQSCSLKTILWAFAYQNVRQIEILQIMNNTMVVSLKTETADIFATNISTENEYTWIGWLVGWLGFMAYQQLQVI